MGVADSRVYSALLRFVRPEDIEPVMARLRARRVPYSTARCNAALSTLCEQLNTPNARRMLDVLEPRATGPLDNDRLSVPGCFRRSWGPTAASGGRKR